MNQKYAIFTIVLILLAVGFYFGYQKKGEEKIDNIPTKTEDLTPVTIQKENISEPNFTGTKINISGSRAVSLAARTYVDTTISEFKQRADAEVPKLRKDFPDLPISNYSIDFEGKYLKSATTESVVVSGYEYTGGANGMSTYRVFTASIPENEIISLSSVIKADKQTAFTAYVKKALNDNKMLGVFPEDVAKLNFARFTYWSMDDSDLTLYFDKYAIAPGASGAVAFPIPLVNIGDFLAK